MCLCSLWLFCFCKQKTAYEMRISDWSSDVCSSDLLLGRNKDIASCEVTPQHLTLAAEDAYPRLGTHAQMNPPIRSAAHRDGLWRWLDQGVPENGRAACRAGVCQYV